MLKELKAQLEQKNLHLASQIGKLIENLGQTEVQLAESERNLAKEINKVTQFRNESNKTKVQLKEKEKQLKS
ncbi:MAG: hypothetical protein ACR5KV_02095 [Wolbachia sp.]